MIDLVALSAAVRHDEDGARFLDAPAEAQLLAEYRAMEDYALGYAIAALEADYCNPMRCECLRAAQTEQERRREAAWRPQVANVSGFALEAMLVALGVLSPAEMAA